MRLTGYAAHNPADWYLCLLFNFYFPCAYTMPPSLSLALPEEQNCEFFWLSEQSAAYTSLELSSEITRSPMGPGRLSIKYPTFFLIVWKGMKELHHLLLLSTPVTGSNRTSSPFEASVKVAGSDFQTPSNKPLRRKKVGCH